MTRTIATLKLTLGLILLSTFAQAQYSSEDSLFYKTSVSKVIAVYHQSLGDQQGLFNGSAYARYPFYLTEGHPYFATDAFTDGSLSYDGVWYDKVPLLYDEVSDELITKSPEENMIKLVRWKISSFQLHGGSFIFINSDSIKDKEISEGFYQVLYSGQTVALKKEIKLIKNNLQGGETVQRSIETKTNYYIRKGEQYYAINSMSALLAAFSEHKKELNQFLKENKLRFRNNSENVIINAVSFCDRLTSNK